MLQKLARVPETPIFRATKTNTMKRMLRTSLAIAALHLAAAPLLAQCTTGTEVVIYSTDFEDDDGGFVESGLGDWEYGVIPVTLAMTNCESPNSANSPGGAHSGTKGWGTVLDGCYGNLGGFSGTGFTVNLANPNYVTAELQFAHWYQIFTSFDYIRITANGTQIFLQNQTENSGGWLTQSVDLTPYIGQAAVQIVFDLWATTVVNRPGWYIDDVSVTACATGTVGLAADGATGFRVWPVPAADRLNVEPSTGLGAVQGWVLYDAMGRTLAQGGRSDARLFSIEVAAFHGPGILELRTGQGVHRQRVLLQ